MKGQERPRRFQSALSMAGENVTDAATERLPSLRGVLRSFGLGPETRRFVPEARVTGGGWARPARFRKLSGGGGIRTRKSLSRRRFSRQNEPFPLSPARSRRARLAWTYRPPASRSVPLDPARVRRSGNSSGNTPGDSLMPSRPRQQRPPRRHGDTGQEPPKADQLPLEAAERVPLHQLLHLPIRLL